jgi:hypothetical protein
MRQDIDHRQAPVRQELLKYINMTRAEMTAKMVPELSHYLSHCRMRQRCDGGYTPWGSRERPEDR